MSIQIDHLSKIYDTDGTEPVCALSEASLEIRSGDFVGVMGQTGCGKSTLMQLIAGLITPSEGSVVIDGMDIFSSSCDYSRLRSSVGVVFQYPESQLFETTVGKDVAFGLRHLPLEPKEKRERVRWALSSMGFDPDVIEDVSPLGLSGGERRRVAIAGILAVKPAYLLLDEPIAGLDPEGRIRFMDFLRARNEEGTTIIMISHNADCLAEYANRIIVLEAGRIIRDATPEELFCDVEWVHGHGLEVSQAAHLAARLRKDGWEIPPGVFRQNDLKDAILRTLPGVPEH